MKLDLSDLRLQIKSEKNKKYVFDVLRKKYVLLTPEEYVRQLIISKLTEHGFPKGLMSIEKALPGSSKRYDLLVYNTKGHPIMLVECKAPDVELDQRIITQVSSYLMKIDCPYVLLSNGLRSYVFHRSEEGVVNSEQIPEYSDLNA